MYRQSNARTFLRSVNRFLVVLWFRLFRVALALSTPTSLPALLCVLMAVSTHVISYARRRLTSVRVSPFPLNAQPPPCPLSQKYRTNLGAPPSPPEIETGLRKEDGAPTNGGGGSGGRSSDGGGGGGKGALADTVQEAEDLEALLMGGGGRSGISGHGISHVGMIDPV